MKNNIKPITTKDIECIHPMCMHSESDVYFAQLARKILNELSRDKFIVTNFSRCLWEISLKSAIYFEDVISELGLFAGLRKMHKQMFGKKLPFLTLNNDYLDDEINIEDLQFLIWMIMQESVAGSENMRFLNAENPAIKMVAAMIMDILENEYETAPANEKLYYWLHEHSYNDFFEFRSLLSWLHYDSYLSMNYPNGVIEEYWEELEKRPSNDLPVSPKQFLYTVKNNRIFSAICTPLAVKAVDWWKKITVNEEILNILNGIEYRSRSYYKIKKIEDDLLEVSPLLNDKETLVLDCNSFQSEGREKEKNMIYATLVKFKELWQVNGSMLVSEGADEVFKIESEKEEKEENNKKGALVTYEKMMEHTGNKPLVFFKTFDEWAAFFKQVFPNMENMDDTLINDMKSVENLTLFVHQTAGATTIPDIAQIIKMPGNKLYDKEAADDYGISMLCGLISTSLEFLECVIENNLLPDVKLNSLKGEAHGKKLVQDNMWFIVRFFQPELFNDKIM
ncbi:MAG: DUF3843 family protein [Dysgonamonadaceae bacterium]|jgi:hypothetical protein|nr:DUF3843 family protein [Dysgonamonadaceae bacterium]